MLIGKRILAIGAHPDDIELGAGGYLSRLWRETNADITFVLLTSGEYTKEGPNSRLGIQREYEAQEAAAIYGANVLCMRLPDCGLLTVEHDTIRLLENAINTVQPNLILTQMADDLHSDHRVAYTATMSAARSFAGSILCYQSPSTKPTGINANYLVCLPELAIKDKLDSLVAYQSQQRKNFLRKQTILAMATAWGQFFRLQDCALEVFEIERIIG